LAGGAQPLTLYTYQLSTDGLNTPNPNGGLQPLAGTVNLNVTLGNSNNTAGTLASTTVTIPAGTSQNSVSFTPVTPGASTTVSVNQPGGWTAPGLYSNIDLSQLLINVTN
jgi:hypothetical protein